MVSRYGMWTGFSAYLLLSVPCVYCAWNMEFKLGAKHASNKQQQQQEDMDSVELQKAAAQPQISDDRNCTGSTGSTATVLTKGMTLHQQQQQQDDQLQHVDQGELEDLEQQRLLLHARNAPEPAGDHHQQQQQHIRQEQQLAYSTAARSVEDADACVVLLHSTDTAAVSSQSLQQVQHIHRPAHAVDEHSSSSGTGKQQGAKSLQQQQQQQVPVDFWQGLRQLLSSPPVLIFMWQATVMGFGIGE
jgi:hypothetical protein